MRNTDILIVDDEIGIREVLQETLEDEGYTVVLAENAEQARRLRNQARPALVLLDIWMPDSDGITLLKEWAKNGQLTMPVVMMSGHGSIDTAVEATKIGALDFLEKPIPLQKLLNTVESALKHGANQQSHNLSVEQLGNSNVIKELNQQLQKASTQNNPILLVGEAGSPFELIARSFHVPNTVWLEPNKLEQITETPLELLQKATGGILYLGNMAQYSRGVQYGIGFLLTKAERYNTRVIYCSSTPIQDLLGNQHAGETPEARLVSVLSSCVVNVPALRQHSEDIPILVEHMMNEMPEGKGIQFTANAMNQLRQYNWPGNLDQLRNIVSSLVLNCTTGEINEHTVHHILNQFHQEETVCGFNFNLPLRELREELERRYFEYHIRQENHNMSRVALKVGLERTHLYRKLKQLGVAFARRGADKPTND